MKLPCHMLRFSTGSKSLHARLLPSCWTAIYIAFLRFLQFDIGDGPEVRGRSRRAQMDCDRRHCWPNLSDGHW